jgi:hypothetical protein
VSCWITVGYKITLTDSKVKTKSIKSREASHSLDVSGLSLKDRGLVLSSNITVSTERSLFTGMPCQPVSALRT